VAFAAKLLASWLMSLSLPIFRPLMLAVEAL
jgi:hypothetical protein